MKKKLPPKAKIKRVKIRQKEKERKMKLKNLLMIILLLDPLKQSSIFKNLFKPILDVGELKI